MARFFNLFLVGLFATYFYLEYQKPNVADAAQPAPQAPLALDTAPESDTEDPVRVALAAATDASRTDAAPATNLVAEPVNPVLEPSELAAIADRLAASRRMAAPMVTPEPEPEVAAVAVEEPAPAPSPVIFTVTGSVVNARSGPGTGFEVVTRLRRGAQLFATGESEGVWAKFVVSDTGQEVWMHTGFIAQSG